MRFHHRLTDIYFKFLFDIRTPHGEKPNTWMKVLIPNLQSSCQNLDFSQVFSRQRLFFSSVFGLYFGILRLSCLLGLGLEISLVKSEISHNLYIQHFLCLNSQPFSHKAYDDNLRERERCLSLSCFLNRLLKFNH